MEIGNCGEIQTHGYSYSTTSDNELTPEFKSVPSFFWLSNLIISWSIMVLLCSWISIKKTLRENLEQVHFWCAVENLPALLQILTTNKKYKPFTVYICFLGVRVSEDTNLFAIVSTISRKLLNLYHKNQDVGKTMTTTMCRTVHKKQDPHFNTAIISMSILLPVLKKADYILLLCVKKLWFLLKNHSVLSQHYTGSAGTGKVTARVSLRARGPRVHPKQMHSKGK